MIGAILLMALFIAGFAGILIYGEKQGDNRVETVRMITFLSLGTIVIIGVIMGIMMINNFK
ncbi:hypothetical protein [Phosphitispora fastidiosa]|uniref:hypothetical protein n=1 Tax=Phosphitispora fastidiosa TaxID=2837202 RepID=UPI001E352B2A|nr:hypothetical protein [Phosphitispora fastidiosa]MBU7007949.1 putative protein HemY [Phosphitispora fastidiosa]